MKRPGPWISAQAPLAAAPVPLITQGLVLTGAALGLAVPYRVGVVTALIDRYRNTGSRLPGVVEANMIAPVLPVVTFPGTWGALGLLVACTHLRQLWMVLVLKVALLEKAILLPSASARMAPLVPLLHPLVTPGMTPLLGRNCSSALQMVRLHTRASFVDVPPVGPSETLVLMVTASALFPVVSVALFGAARVLAS